MNRYEIYSKRLIWSGAFLLTAFMAGCGGGGDGGGAPSGGPGPTPTPTPQAGPAHYDLQAAASFSAGSGGGIQNTGTSTAVTGDLGTTAASATITGFHDSTGAVYTENAANIGSVSGTIFTHDAPAADAGATADAVAVALGTAFAAWSPTGSPGGTEPNATVAGELGGQTLVPGTYRSAVLQITGGDLTLDAQGNPDAFWILQSDSTLTVGDAAARSVILANGADSKNVYWYVPGSVIINAAGGGTMTGSIITSNSLDISSAAGAATPTTLNGRAFLMAGSAIHMFNAVINKPAP